MCLKRVSWVRRYQGQCRALRPLGHQGYRLRSYKKDQPLCSGYRRKGRFVRPLTTVWGDQNSLGGDFITAGSRLAGVYPPWFCYEFEGAAPGGVGEMVFVGGKWEVISVQNRKDVYGPMGQWLQVRVDLRGYDAEYQAAARGICQKTFFVRAERAMGVHSWWGATLDRAEWRAEHLVAPPAKKTIKTQDKSVYERGRTGCMGMSFAGLMVMPLSSSTAVEGLGEGWATASRSLPSAARI